VSTYAMAAEGDRFSRLLPGGFLTWALSGVFFEALYAAPCTREINVIQQVIGRSFSHKLSEIMVSTMRARRGHNTVGLPGVQTKTGR
jgi:hypothetical protein